MFKSDGLPIGPFPRGIKPSESIPGLGRPVCRDGAVGPRRNRRHPSRNKRFPEWNSVGSGLAPRPPNLLIAGASGHVAQAFLARLTPRRAQFGRLVLLDPEKTVLESAWLDHRKLDYQFINRRLCFPGDRLDYQRLLQEHRIDIVLDLTDLDTLPILAATDEAGVSYVNTALNDSTLGIVDTVAALHSTRQLKRNARHIIGSGMNPGVVNIWVWHAVRHYGVPSEIVHFEFDSSTPVSGWRPMISWSRKEFLSETVWDPTGWIVDGQPMLFQANSLLCRQSLQPILEPVMPLIDYPKGYLVLHEENVKLGQKLGASSRYIYAIHPKTMEYLDRLWRRRGRLEIDDLEIGDNTTVPLDGSDTIGVYLDYPDYRIYYLHSLANASVKGSNATCAQVAVGIDAALSALLFEPLSPRIYFSSDLYDTLYRDVVFDGLHVDHFVFARRDGLMALRHHKPALHRRRVSMGDEAETRLIP